MPSPVSCLEAAPSQGSFHSGVSVLLGVGLGGGSGPGGVIVCGQAVGVGLSGGLSGNSRAGGIIVASQAISIILGILLRSIPLGLVAISDFV